MKKVSFIAARVGLGLMAVFGFFSFPQIAELFSPAFLILIKQVLALAFSICLLLNPQQLIDMGTVWGPKLLNILTLLFSNNNKKDKDGKL